jgi:hypothetical protein
MEIFNAAVGKLPPRRFSASVFNLPAYVHASCPSKPRRRSGPPERWQSGLLYLTRNQACPQGYRGFESLPLRHPSLGELRLARPSPGECPTGAGVMRSSRMMSGEAGRSVPSLLTSEARTPSRSRWDCHPMNDKHHPGLGRVGRGCGENVRGIGGCRGYYR